MSIYTAGRRGGLRGADGTVHRKTGYGNAIQSHRIPDSVFRIMRHKGGLGAAGSRPAVFPVALVEVSDEDLKVLRGFNLL